MADMEKKVIKVHKKHSIVFDRDAPFSIGGVYQIIAETLIDSGELVIDRTDDGTKVEFVWHLETESEHS